jgi:hypothetical protein
MEMLFIKCRYFSIEAKCILYCSFEEYHEEQFFYQFRQRVINRSSCTLIYCKNDGNNILPI